MYLYQWYNTERLSKRAYGDIIDRWKAMCEEYGHDEEDIPEIEEITGSDTWLLLTRGIFEGEEARVPLAERT